MDKKGQSTAPSQSQISGILPNSWSMLVTEPTHVRRLLSGAQEKPLVKLGLTLIKIETDSKLNWDYMDKNRG